MSLFKHPEGPPSADDMQLLVFDLLFTNELDEAYEIAAVMVDHWIEMPREQQGSTHSFGYWLGIKSATANVLSGRRDRRREKRAPRRRHA